MTALDERVAAALPALADRDDPAAMGRAVPRLHALLPTIADPTDAPALLGVLRCLHAVGRRDLPMGRLFEGHVDAVQIALRLAAPEIAAQVRALAAAGATFGVWNAELPGEPLRLADGRLSGGKGFASGAGILSHALVGADAAGGRRLLLLDLAQVPPAIDRGWWKTIGMARSYTHLVRWDGAPVPAAAVIGTGEDYAREPWFSGGALRFVAVHAGGIAALFDGVRDHLVAAGRAEDPYQVARLATLYTLAQAAAAAVRTLAEDWFGLDDAVRLPRVAAARMQVAGLADQGLALAQQAVGVQALFAAHPLSAAITDLSVYLRQPAPDAQVARVGRAAAAGHLSPAL